MVLLLAGPGLLPAQQHPSQPQEAGGAERHAHVHPNHVAVFAGATSELREGKKSHFTLGADYVRRFGAEGRWALGGFGEVIFDDEPEWLVGAAGYFFPTSALWVQAGAGMEFYKEGHGTTEPAETRTSFLLRVGAGYIIELSGFSVTPLALLDLARDTESLVWGVSVAKGF